MKKIKKQNNNLPVEINESLTVGEVVDTAVIEVVKSVAKGVPVLGLL